MIAIGLLFIRMLCDFFKPRTRLEAEILILRHQLNVLQQRMPRGLCRLRSPLPGNGISRAEKKAPTRLPNHRSAVSETKRCTTSPPIRGLCKHSQEFSANGQGCAAGEVRP
jgi:hypothetical protein